MHAMNKMQNKRQKPNHEGNIISHLRKRQELELRIWKVVSGALHFSSWMLLSETLEASHLPLELDQAMAGLGEWPEKI